jgi:2-polyprenyl-3-methyl-5-hydroxy-6-metoxy-1,4-benzoquinol methylase
VSSNANVTDFSIKPEGYYAQSRPEMLAFIPKASKRILDVGCSEGKFGLQLKQTLNAEVWGVEMVAAAAETARQRLDRVLVGDIMQQLQLLPDDYFDCIIFNDVIEHLVDPYLMLVAVKQKLTTHGVIVASIPNVRFFPTLWDLVVHGNWRYQEQGTLDKTHLRFFTKKSIVEMFETLGYRLRHIQGINPIKWKKAKLLKLITLGRTSDTEYLQFACVAEPLGDAMNARANQ